MSSISTLKFPFKFDAQRLQNDAREFSATEWQPHFNTQYYAGDWSGIALRAPKNARVQLYSDPNSTEGFAATEMLARCDYMPQVLAAFECEMTSVRLLKLGAGSQIRRHRDYQLGFEDGEIRIHIPVATNPQVEFMLDERKLEMNVGEAWYLNFNLYHSVHNRGATDRVHLVIDCVVNAWLLAFFPQTQTA